MLSPSRSFILRVAIAESVAPDLPKRHVANLLLVFLDALLKERKVPIFWSEG